MVNIVAGIMAIIAVILFFISRKRGLAKEGIQHGIKQIISFFPVIVVAFIMAGMIQVLLPREFVGTWLAEEAGMSGILFGTIGGSILAIGPFVSFPMINSIYLAGAGLGTVIALITGWCILSFSRLPYEAVFLGFKFTLIRIAICIPLVILAGGIGLFIGTTLLP